MDQQEQQSQKIFRSIGPVQAPPYMVTRVMAELKQPNRRELWVWRALTATAFAAVVALVGYIQLHAPSQSVFFTSQPYVIQMDVSEFDQAVAVSAEIELPDGVNFVSKSVAVHELRSLRMPLANVKNGKLPFVLVSERAGSMLVKVRLYDSADKLLAEKQMLLEFKTGNS